MKPFHPPGKVDRYTDRSLNIARRSAPIVASFAKVFRSLKQGKLTSGDGFSFPGFDKCSRIAAGDTIDRGWD